MIDLLLPKHWDAKTKEVFKRKFSEKSLKKIESLLSKCRTKEKVKQQKEVSNEHKRT